MADYEVKIYGGEDLRAKLNDETLTAGPIRQMLRSIAVLLRRAAREHSPVDTGRMRSSLTYEMDAQPMPHWARVGTNVTAPRSHFPYPAHLEGSTRTHYRRTKRRGQPTQGWFSSTVPEQMPAIEVRVLEALRRIGEKWTATHGPGSK